MNLFALAAFEARLVRSPRPVELEVPAPHADDYRRIASQRGWIFQEHPKGPGWVRISCELAPRETGGAS